MNHLAVAAVSAVWLAACGGKADGGESAGATDASIDSLDNVSNKGGDASLTGDAWWAGYDAPVLGEYPDPSDTCATRTICSIGGTCDTATGWCCHGQFAEGDAGALCVCGKTLGCAPEQVCCVAHELEEHCTATSDCEGGI